MRTFAALLTMLAGLSGWPASAQSPGVVVDYNAPHLVVQITQPSTLRGVLQEVCRVTQARCEWDEKALQVLGAETVPAVVFRGTWTEALTQLLAGTKLDYAAFEPGEGQSGRLLVEYREPVITSLAADNGRHGAENRELPRGSRSPVGRLVTSDRDASDSEVDPAIVQSDETRSLQSAPETSPPSAAGMSEPVVVEPPEAVVFMDRQSAPYTGPPVSPFPDEMGNPVPVSEQPTYGSPFPGVEVKPPQAGATREGQPPESPFPP